MQLWFLLWIFVLQSLGILIFIISDFNSACDEDGNLHAGEDWDVSANWPELLVPYGKDLQYLH